MDASLAREAQAVGRGELAELRERVGKLEGVVADLRVGMTELRWMLRAAVLLGVVQLPFVAGFFGG